MNIIKGMNSLEFNYSAKNGWSPRSSYILRGRKGYEDLILGMVDGLGRYYTYMGPYNIDIWIETGGSK